MYSIVLGIRGASGATLLPYQRMEVGDIVVLAPISDQSGQEIITTLNPAPTAVGVVTAAGSGGSPGGIVRRGDYQGYRAPVAPSCRWEVIPGLERLAPHMGGGKLDCPEGLGVPVEATITGICDAVDRLREWRRTRAGAVRREPARPVREVLGQ